MLNIQPKSRILKRLYDCRVLIIMFIPIVLYYALFDYSAMFGLAVAFKNFNVFKGFWASPWVGFKYFRLLFYENPDFLRLVRNTFLLGFYLIIFEAPTPIFLALLLNEIRNAKFKKLVQTVSYLPHFLSNVIIASMVLMFLSPDGGLVVNFLKLFGVEPIYYMSRPELFRPVYILSGIWQEIGWGAIIYLAGIANIDVGLYEAAELDGAGRFGKMFHVTIPCIIPVIVISFVLKVGGIFSTSFEKVVLLYNPATYSVADIFSTYTYRVGIQSGNFSYATAIGLFSGVVNFILIVIANESAKRLSSSSLW